MPLLLEARSALGEGDLTRAISRAEEAVEADPGAVEPRRFLASLLMKINDYHYARISVEKALEIEPGDADSREMLGDILYQEGRLAEAAEEWERALSAGRGDAHLRGKIARARTESAMEESFGVEVSRNFTVKYDGPVPKVVVRSLLWHLEKAHRTLESHFDSSPPGDNIVILYTRQDYHRLTASPQWAGGSYDGKIRIPVGGLSTEAEAEALGPLLAHELTHAFLRRVAGRRLPLWFEEGVAVHFQWEETPEDTVALMSRWAAPFESLEAIDAGLRGRNGPVEAAYSSAALAVRLLVRERGFESVLAMITGMGAGATFEEALEDAGDMTLEEYFALLKRPGAAHGP